MDAFPSKTQFLREKTDLDEIMLQLGALKETIGDVAIRVREVPRNDSAGARLTNIDYFLDVSKGDEFKTLEIGSATLLPDQSVHPYTRTNHLRSFCNVYFFLEKLLARDGYTHLDVSKAPSLNFKRVHWDNIFNGRDPTFYVFNDEPKKLN